MSCLLRANQLGLVENMTMLLTPFEQLTREISSRLATTVDVIPSKLLREGGQLPSFVIDLAS